MTLMLAILVLAVTVYAPEQPPSLAWAAPRPIVSISAVYDSNPRPPQKAEDVTFPAMLVTP